jgi:RNA polymerase sigma-70 factor (ECF subfamily)
MIDPFRGLYNQTLPVADAELLFSEHRSGVFRYLCRIVGHAETARDLTQEVFLRVSRAGVPESGDAAVRAWLFRIARNLALNHIRDGKRRPQTVAIDERAAPATQEIGAAIAEALAALPDVDRDVFVLRESVGLSYEDIAAACGLTVEAIRSRLRRTRQELRERLRGAIRAQRVVRFKRMSGDER